MRRLRRFMLGLAVWLAVAQVASVHASADDDPGDTMNGTMMAVAHTPSPPHPVTPETRRGSIENVATLVAVSAHDDSNRLSACLAQLDFLTMTFEVTETLLEGSGTFDDTAAEGSTELGAARCTIVGGFEDGEFTRVGSVFDAHWRFHAEVRYEDEEGNEFHAEIRVRMRGRGSYILRAQDLSVADIVLVLDGHNLA